jgi:hypothetical protein
MVNGKWWRLEGEGWRANGERQMVEVEGWRAGGEGFGS